MDDLSADEIREHRGTLTEPGRNSPWRDRTVEENLDLFERMRKGEFPDGSRVLRAKIDMASGNINLRDPVMYRILHARAPAHGRRLVHLPDLRLRARPVRRHRGHHPLDLHAGVRGPSAALRLVRREPARALAAAAVRVRAPEPHLHRALEALPAAAGERGARARLGRPAHAHDLGHPPARLSRRGAAPVRGDDRRGPARERRRVRDARALRARRAEPHRRRGAWPCCGRSRSCSRTTPRARSRSSRRSTTPRTRPRARARCRSRASSGSSATTSWRTRPRSSSGSPPAARCACASAYFITCQEVVKDAAGEVVELRCTYDPATRGGSAPDGRSPKATLHWVSAAHAIPGEVRLYDHLFRRPDPGAEGDLLDDLNPQSEEVLTGLPARARPAAAARRARACSSSGWATSAWTRTPPPSAPSSTAP